MGGSLEQLARTFEESRLPLDGMGRWFGEIQFGRVSRIVLGAIEGTLFGACVAGAIRFAGGRSATD